LDDCRRDIAAGKIQRWEVVKWGITLHIAVVGASSLPGQSFWFLLTLSIMISIVSWALVRHYNSRTTDARKTAVTVVEWLTNNGVDYEAITKIKSKEAYATGESYDKFELRAFAIILGMPPLIAFVWWYLGR